MKDEIGVKAYNLTRLQGFGMPVPEFYAFDHATIIQLFLDAGLDLAAEWHNIVNAYQEPKTWINYLQEQDIEGGLLDLLQKRIIATAKTTAFKEKLQTTKVQHLLTSLQASDHVMVRSSGNEDSAATEQGAANQGGNESHPATTSYADIAAKIGLVVASSYKLKSFQQRSISEETTQLQNLPRASLFVQKLITEADLANSESQIVSGVVFTTEPSLRTPGIMAINAAFGHGEGVVEGKVVVDQYYVTKADMVFAAAPTKLSRMSPQFTATGSLEITEVANIPQQANTACLPYNAILKLAAICRSIQMKFGSDTLDIEWVYDRALDQFQILQVREMPRLKSNPKRQPEYLSLTSEQLQSRLYSKVKVGVSTQYDVLEITAATEILCAKNIQTALRDFGQLKDPSKIKVIFIEGSVVETSHEASVFRDLKVPIPVLSVRSIADFAAENLKLPVVVDQQNGNILSGSKAEFKVATGLSRHPVELQLTLDSKQQQLNNHDISSMLQWMDTDIIPDNRKILDIIAALRTNPYDAIDAAQISGSVKMLVRRTLNLYINTYNRIESDLFAAEIKQDLQIMCSNSLQSCLALHNLFDTSDTIDKRTLLFFLGTLEHTITQQADALHPHSAGLVSLLKRSPENSYDIPEADIKQLVNILDDLETDSPDFDELLNMYFGPEDIEPITYLSPEVKRYSSLLVALERLIWDEDNKRSWIEFIGSLTSENDLKQVATLIAFYKTHGVLDFWLQTLFIRARKTPGITTLSLILNENIKGLEEANMIAARLTTAKELTAAWSRPDNFYTRLEAIQKLADATTSLFIESQKNTTRTNVVKYKYILLLEQAIDNIDLSLKAISSSTEYTDEKLRLDHFNELLKIYIKMTKTICDTWYLEIEKDLRLTRLSLSDFFDNIDSSMEKCKQTLAAGEITNLLELKPNFQVNYGILSNLANSSDVFQLGEGKHLSLEELFTLCHQNLISVIIQAKKSVGVRESLLPNAIKKLAATIASIDIEGTYGGGHASLLGIERNTDKIRIIYNCPLCSHAARITINYDPKIPNDVQIDVSVFLADETDRFRRIFKNSRLMAAVNKFRYQQHLAPSKAQTFGESYSEIGFTFGVSLSDFESQNNIKSVSKAINFILLDTFDIVDEVFPFDKVGYIEKVSPSIFNDGLDGATDLFYTFVKKGMHDQACNLIAIFFSKFLESLRNGNELNTSFLDYNRGNYNIRSKFMQHMMHYLVKLLNDPNHRELATTTIKSVFSDPASDQLHHVLTEEYLSGTVLLALCRVYSDASLPPVLHNETRRRAAAAPRSSGVVATAHKRLKQELNPETEPYIIAKDSFEYKSMFLEYSSIALYPRIPTDIVLKVLIAMHKFLSKYDNGPRLEIVQGSAYDPFIIKSFIDLMQTSALNYAAHPEIQKFLLSHNYNIAYLPDKNPQKFVSYIQNGSKIEIGLDATTPPFVADIVQQTAHLIYRYNIKPEIYLDLMASYTPETGSLDPIIDRNYINLFALCTYNNATAELGEEAISNCLERFGKLIDTADATKLQPLEKPIMIIYDSLNKIAASEDLNGESISLCKKIADKLRGVYPAVTALSAAAAPRISTLL